MNAEVIYPGKKTVPKKDMIVLIVAWSYFFFYIFFFWTANYGSLNQANGDKKGAGVKIGNKSVALMKIKIGVKINITFQIFDSTIVAEGAKKKKSLKAWIERWHVEWNTVTLQGVEKKQKKKENDLSQNKKKLINNLVIFKSSFTHVKKKL